MDMTVEYTPAQFAKLAHELRLLASALDTLAEAADQDTRYGYAYDSTTATLMRLFGVHCGR